MPLSFPKKPSGHSPLRVSTDTDTTPVPVPAQTDKQGHLKPSAKLKRQSEDRKTKNPIHSRDNPTGPLYWPLDEEEGEEGERGRIRALESGSKVVASIGFAGVSSSPLGS